MPVVMPVMACVARDAATRALRTLNTSRRATYATINGSRPEDIIRPLYNEQQVQHKTLRTMRRSNKSHKVPNVKLRPAQADPAPSRSHTRPDHEWLAQDSQVDRFEDQSAVDLCPRPMKGLMLCATGISDKPTLFKQAIELGAMVVSAFTDQVTHLIAITHGGAKYSCALERKVPILKPSWITDNYAAWLKGDDVDLDMESHRLPLFSDVHLCCTGIHDIQRRAQISREATRRGGFYYKALERPVRVTHLLCSGDEVTEKMMYAEKFNQRGEAEIKVVWEEWFWDSIEFGGRFDEENYLVSKPRPEKKTSSQAPPKIAPEPAPSLGVRQNSEDFGDEIVSVQRLPDVTLQVWSSLLKSRGFEVTNGKLVRSPTKSQLQPQLPEDGGSPSPKPQLKRPPNEGGSILSGFRRANSFALDSAPVSSARPFKRAATLVEQVLSRPDAGLERTDVPKDRQEPAEPSASSSSSNRPLNIFTNVKFAVLGDANAPVVRTAIESSGGAVVSSTEDADYIIVRLASGSTLYCEEKSGEKRCKYRTECWLEQCIFKESVCPPEEHMSFQPLQVNQALPGVENVLLSYSGLDQSEALWIRRLASALGLKVQPNFSRRVTHLFCPSASGVKYAKAKEWGVSVVGMDWLRDVAARGLAGSDPANSAARKEASASQEPGVSRHRPSSSAPPNDRDKSFSNDDESSSWKPRSLAANESYPHSFAVEPSSMFGGTDFGAPILLLSHKSSGDSAGAINMIDDDAEDPDAPPAKKQRRSPSTSSPPPQMPPSSPSTGSLSDDALVPPPSVAEIKREMKRTRIPSSKSPSPLKIPPLPQPQPMQQLQAVTHPDASPPKVSKALHESITNLLEKGQQADAEAGGVNQNPVMRSGKRSRPVGRTKSGLSRKPTADDDFLPPPPMMPVVYEGDNEAPESDGAGDLSAGDESRVMYEDPGQRDEQRRLMSLLGSPGSHAPTAAVGSARGTGNLGGGGEQGSTATKRRTSTRIAGF